MATAILGIVPPFVPYEVDQRSSRPGWRVTVGTCFSVWGIIFLIHVGVIFRGNVVSARPITLDRDLRASPQPPIVPIFLISVSLELMWLCRPIVVVHRTRRRRSATYGGFRFGFGLGFRVMRRVWSVEQIKMRMKMNEMGGGGGGGGGGRVWMMTIFFTAVVLVHACSFDRITWA